MAKVKKEKVSEEDLRKVKKTKVKKPRDIRSVFRETLAALVANGGVSHIKKPWMSTKDFRLLDTPETLQEWCDDVLANAPKFKFFDGLLPVVALDTETLSLDTRLFVRLRRLPDGTYQQYYEIKTDIGGICLSADGVRGVYIPINHEFQDLELTVPAKCIDRRRCAEILQKFFDQAHLVFYNGKFDREVLRLTMGNTFKPYPWFEDVQVLAYINDPKANLEDKKFYTGDAGGLKSLTRNILGIEQIELDEIAKVRAETCPDTGLPFCHCPMDSRKEKKHGLRNHFVPFSWVPVELALWYGGSDGICTWLLWEKMYKLARSRRTVHRIDHELVDALSWIERQRFVIDVDRHRRTVQGHQKKIDAFKRKLYDLGIKSGYDELKTDEGDVAEKDKFNPGSPKQLQKLLYKVMKYPVLKKTPTGEASTDAETIEDLIKAHPEDEFLTTYQEYSDYKALHPGDLRFDSTDNSARIYLKQNVVAGGRLSSAGGEFEKDGGFGLNSQAVKKVESYLMWKVSGDILVPDPEEIAIDQIEEHPEEDLHSSCFQEVEEDVIIGYKDDTAITDDDSLDSPLPIKVPIVEKRKVRKQAPGIVHNHIGMYMGYVVCLVPGCKTCSEKYGILIPDTKIDANEVVNLRVLFCAPAGWTYFSIDWGNIEMRAAANCLAGDTKALIREKGFSPLKDNIGKATLLNSKKEWVESEIKSFGIKPLRRVVIGHNKVNTFIYATPDHRWNLADGSEKTTDDLAWRDEIPFVRTDRSSFPLQGDYLLGIRHGIIYGDGSRSLSGRKGKGAAKGGIVACPRERGYRIRLCGKDKQLLVPYFDGYAVSYPYSSEGDPVVQLFDEFTATHNLKTLPDENETAAYLVGFFRGWLSADGHSGTDGVSICCGPDEEKWLRRVMPQFGYYFLGSSELSVETYFCSSCYRQVKTVKPVLKDRVCAECRAPIHADAEVVLKTRKFQRRDYRAKKRSKGVSLFRPCLTEDDFLLAYKRENFLRHRFELHETVRRVELTDRVEETFCAVVPGTHNFVIENGLLTGNCSGEPEFIKEFLQGKGDFHSLTASKVFPEFNDPNTSPAVKKMLRGLAKIINFALLYAGTAYTIFENMKKQKPDITFSEAEEMVKKYWEGTPVFKEWCQRKQAIARDQLICTTTTGRVINFQSAMDALHIHVPTEEERKNFWKYRDLKKRGEELKKAGNPDAVKYLATAQAMWKNLDTGVRNCMDYNKFMGKIQRVSVNAPLQGLAGDFMRMSLNKIHQWVVSDPEVASVILLHCSVHDEIDFSCKDEYVPFVVPRMTRLMKLRRLHELMKWPVPIETDAEYGYSWDVEHHVTGDDDHAAAAWTKIKVIANYLPLGCDPTTTRNLIKAIASQDPVKAAKADAFLKANLHPRAYEAAQTCFLKKTKKGTVPQTDVREIARALIASLQLDEYWTIDNTPDNEGDKLETLAQYEARNGLTSADRNPEALLYGPLGALSLDSEVVRPIPEPLMVNVPPPGGDLGYPGFPEVPSPLIEVSAPIQEISSPVMESPPVEKTWELADLDPVQATQLRFLMMEKGDIRLRVRMRSDEFWLPPSSLDHIPDKFLKK